MLLPLLFASFFSPALCGSSVQAEAMYQISESELTTLEQNLQTLEAHSRQKEQQLTALNSQLTVADKALQKANEQLAESRRQNEATATSLEKANQSLTELEQEAKRKIRVKTRQRNIWIAISGLLAGAAIAGR